ncbi:Uncharacterized protein FWK35_00018836 [Aphis craccivora]|uniref:Uncharacterized protein n=1 Tax=Aphis craccivora TaxID=307492 RepID=A0A6G0Y2N6_APHCR|nr:Uncharacterized protein FWK35_00018836 [Aphis craccivora]
MALNDAEIENLLRGDMSDIEDFNAEITEFIDLNNAEMDNLVNNFDNTEEANVEKENEVQLPANWVTGS